MLKSLNHSLVSPGSKECIQSDGPLLDSEIGAVLVGLSTCFIGFSVLPGRHRQQTSRVTQVEILLRP